MNYVQFIDYKNKKVVDFLLTKMSDYIDVIIPRGEKMVATKDNQKSTAMDYFAAPRHEGLVVGILEKIGYTAGDGGRLPGTL